MENKKLTSKKGDNGLYGFADTDGNWVIEPKYSVVSEFFHGRALVSDDEETWGVIDEKGEYVIDQTLDGFLEDDDAFRCYNSYGEGDAGCEINLNDENWVDQLDELLWDELYEE